MRKLPAVTSIEMTPGLLCIEKCAVGDALYSLVAIRSPAKNPAFANLQGT